MQPVDLIIVTMTNSRTHEWENAAWIVHPDGMLLIYGVDEATKTSYNVALFAPGSWALVEVAE